MGCDRDNARSGSNLEPLTTLVPAALARHPIHVLTNLARYFKWIFYLSTGSVILDFLLNMIWLPIATAQTYGFRSTHDAFMTTYNGTGASAGWNWCLSYLATAGILIGFDASGHVAEETRNASIAAAQGIFWSTIVSGLGGFVVVILFLFCVVSTLFCGYNFGRTY